MGLSASYFDGKTSRKLNVEFSVEGGLARISGDVERRCPLGQLRVSEPMRHVKRKITFPDGAFLEIGDTAEFNRLLAATGHRDSLVARAQQSWRGAVLACVAAVAILAALYLYGLPAAAKLIARTLPENVERGIGRETLALLDQRFLSPSRLPEARRNAIATRFQFLAPPYPGAPARQILFRQSRIGPNAFALPSGQIILTDEIVTLFDNDDAVMGVLAHELGHVHERHLLRRIIQSSATGAAITMLTGDLSIILAGLPTLILDLKYSRAAELEADDYAIAMLKANGISLSSLATAFEKLESRSDSEVSPYLASHPSTAERISRIRDAGPLH
ncbi:MAG: putative Peptidase family [Herminiimonas sp.]|nr:putative Peptidase family [Herminiimonas sp.]